MEFERGANLDMKAILAGQKAAHLREGTPGARKRIEWIDRSIDLLLTHCDELNDAMCADFGHRSTDQSKLTDIVTTVEALKFARKHLRKWMKPQRRAAGFPLNLSGARASVHYQPKGVIGVISTWNFPVNLSFSPLAGVFAAGNRAMIKPSEFTPQTSELTAELIGQYYEEDEVAVINGGPEVGAAFSALPFDHIVFTGSTSIGRLVMRAASENLVPLTLELGGKSPVIIGRSADLKKAAMRIMAGKMLNAGQICLAPDYVLVPEEKAGQFVEAAKDAVQQMFPSGLRDNSDYCSIINRRHYERLQDLLEDARSKGARPIEINPQGEDFETQAHNKMAPHLVMDVSEDMKLMQDEIFGPVLPVLPCADTSDAVEFINQQPSPLALYYFGSDSAEQDEVLSNTRSGGVTVNDVVVHYGEEDLPFGGIGPSGMGAYHGRDGFYEFSHKKAVYRQTGAELLSIIRPPYGKWFRKLINSKLKP